MYVCMYIYIYIYIHIHMNSLTYAIFTIIVNSFWTTLTPNPEKSYSYYSVTKQPDTCV